MTTSSLRRAAFLVFLLCGFVFAVPWFTGADASLSRLLAGRTIRIGYALEAPYAFLAPGGEVTGESPEVARRIVASLGIPKVEWRLAAFSELITELEAGRIDVIASGMFITPGRARRVSFSEPTFHVRPGLLVAVGNPRGLHAYTDLRREDVCIAVLSGSVEERSLALLGVDERHVMHVPDVEVGRVAVESGQAQGLALSLPSIRWLAARNSLGETAPAEPFEQAAGADVLHLGYGGFAFRKGDVRLREAWNAAQRDFIGTPAHLDLVGRFGFVAGDMPGRITTAEIVAR